VVRHMISSAVMMLIGLTGGVATGKSTVAKMLEACGAVVIDADELAREVVQPDKPAWREIVHRFGRSVLNVDNTINRQVLGQIAFRNRQKLKQLEHIIHPRVAREQIRLTREAARKDQHAVVVYDVPLLFETGIDKRVDQTIVVTADQTVQIARLRKRNGLTRAEALRRIRSQMPLAMKRRRADHVLDGTMPKNRLFRVVAQTFRQFALEA
jgi:dephospho-CoA kinase